MSKLEWIYNCCTRQVSKEIDLFWKGYDIPKKQLFIDPDNLQGIIIYIVSRLKMPQIISEIHFIKKFVPNGVKRLSRFYHCEMVGAACSYLLEVDKKYQAKLKSTTVKTSQKLDQCYEASPKSSANRFGSTMKPVNRPSFAVQDSSGDEDD